jgi:hypothetical protein
MSTSAALAESVQEIETLPTATPEEMFIIKICASRGRSSPQKELQDIADAEFIAERLHRMSLVGDPLEPALDCLQEFLPKSIYGPEWWEEKLEFSRPMKCTVNDWFAFQAGRGICGMGVLSSNM